MQVAFPHSAACFGRCYTGGAALITDATNLFDGIGRLLATSRAREIPKPVHNADPKRVLENGTLPVAQNGTVHGIERTTSASLDEREHNNVSPEREEQKARSD